MKTILIAAVAALPLLGHTPAPPSFIADEAASQAQPRTTTGPAEPRRDPDDTQGRAQPRPSQPPPAARGGEQRGRRPAPPPPPRVVPPAYYRAPRIYVFPPVHVERGFHYHPYFGFYFGPYYGPYYPFPGPSVGPVRYAASTLRTRVKPVEAQVYVNGYYAGIVDDFDGLFQRLYLPAGGHEVTFRLEGYRTFTQRIYLQAGDTFEITHQMDPASPDEAGPVPAPNGTLPAEWREATPAAATGDQIASPYGALALRVTPVDAQVFIDGEPWVETGDLAELVVHVPAGTHLVEVRKDGHRTFQVEVELKAGETTRLNVRLAP